MEQSAQHKAVMIIKARLVEFRDKLSKFSDGKRQLKEVMSAHAESPLSVEPIKFANPAQAELFRLLDELTAAKLTLLHYGIEEDKLARANAAKSQGESNGEHKQECETGKSNGETTS